MKLIYHYYVGVYCEVPKRDLSKSYLIALLRFFFAFKNHEGMCAAYVKQQCIGDKSIPYNLFSNLSIRSCGNQILLNTRVCIGRRSSRFEYINYFIT